MDIDVGSPQERAEAIHTELMAVEIGLLEAYTLSEIIDGIILWLAKCRRLNREIME